MKMPMDFLDSGASDDEPVKGVLQGHLRDWHDELARLREALILARNDMKVSMREIDRELAISTTSVLGRERA